MPFKKFRETQEETEKEDEEEEENEDEYDFSENEEIPKIRMPPPPLLKPSRLGPIRDASPLKLKRKKWTHSPINNSLTKEIIAPGEYGIRTRKTHLNKKLEKNKPAWTQYGKI